MMGLRRAPPHPAWFLALSLAFSACSGRVDQVDNAGTGGNAGAPDASDARVSYVPCDGSGLPSWHSVRPPDGQGGRSGHSAVWTGSQVLLWGGKPDGAPGLAFDPAADDWKPLGVNQPNAPQWTDDHLAVWTGKYMIIWGGEPTNGEAYDPAADSWRLLPSSGAPAPRVGAVGAWADDADTFYVWGGQIGLTGEDLGDGRGWVPDAGAWNQMGLLGEPPTPRWGAVAVWTGLRILVWGGMATLVSPPTTVGGQYEPYSASWTAMATDGQPPPSDDYTGVWTGTELIVWGGMNAGGPFGGRYDPVANTWSPVSSVGAPSAREKHTAVWTGSKMIIFGGADPGLEPLGDGGIYDPATDTWAPLPTECAPSPREGHTATWTPQGMFVWGGDEGPLHLRPPETGAFLRLE